MEKPAQKRSFSLLKIIEAAQQEATGAKTTSYLTTTIITGLFYAAISYFILTLTPIQYLLPAWIALSFALAISFSPIRYAMEELIRQLFPDSDYNSHSLVKRLNAISYSSLTLDRLSSQFFQEFEVNLNVPNVWFLIKDPSGEFYTKSHGFLDLPQFSNEEIEELARNLHHHPTLVRRIKPDNVRKKLEEHNIAVIVSLMNNEDLFGLLILGERPTHRHYTTKDLKVLAAIAPKLGFAIRNAHEFEAVSRKNKQLISNLETANEELRRANEELRHDAKLKNEFVFIATHELKNPVTAMRGYISLIEEGQFGEVNPPGLKDAVNQISASNQQLITLLNNLLQIARSEAHRLEIHAKPVEICAIIDEVIRDLRPLSNQKNLTVLHDCPNPAITVLADKERLREIVNNLVSNAIKYSDKGTISIHHEVRGDTLYTHVKDEGVGISEEDQKQIFTRFFRVEEEAAKGIPGTGLGLFIIKDLVERMQGKIEFTSALGKGSDFFFSLPLARTYAFKANE